MEQNKDEKKPLKGKRAPSKKRGNTAASSSENVRRKKRKKTGGRSNMPMRDASLPAGQAPGATQPNHDETEAMTNDLCDSINIIKQYIQNKCDDGTVFKNDEFTEDLLAAIIDYHENADTREDTWGTSGHSKAVVEFFANYVVATDNTSQVQPSQKATDANMDDSGGNSEVKAEEKPAETMDDVLAAIEHFAKTITYSNNRSVELTVYLKKKKNFMFSMDDPDDIIEQRKLENNSDPKVTDEDWAWQEQKKLLKDFYKAVGKSNPIQEIHTHNKTTGQKETIPGTDKTMAAKIRRFADEKITPIDLASLKRELEEHIKTNLFDDQKIKNPLNGPPNESAVYEAPLNYINSLVQPHPTLTPNDFFKHNLDKTSVYVVGGESGCGKTWFCAKGIIPHLKVQNQAYLLYLKIHDADKVANSPPPESRFDGNKNVELWLKAVSAILDNNMSFSSRNNMGVLHAILSILELTRAESAQKLLEGMIEAQAPQLFKNWLHGKSSRPIGKLVIVVDGMEHNLDFARAMIDYHRRCLPRKFLHCTPKMLANACSMMLAGTGLEQVKSKWYNFIDTEPSKCELVTLESPNMKVFSWQFSSHKMLTGEEVKQVLEDGTISSILKTNVRMLMTGLKSILDMKQFQAYSKSNYKLRLTDLFSLPSFMELVAERYMGQTRGLREASAADQREYFRCSWRHMLRQRVLSMKDSRSVLKSSYMKRMGIEGREDIHDDHMMPKGAEKEKARDILTLGIATAHYSMVSPALKFLACACDGDVAAKGDRNSFEDMVKYHIKRMLQVIYGENDDADDDDDDEALICEYVLQAAWPEQPSVTNIASYLDEDMPMTELRDCVWKMTAEHDHDLRSIAQMMKPAEDDENDRSVNRPKKEPQEPKAVLISQKSGDAAQGPDLYSLERDENEPYKFWLNLFQIKDMRTLEGATAAEMVSSLGALTSRNGALDDAIDTDLAEVVEYEGDNNKFAKLLNEIHAAIEANTSMPSEDSSRMVELKMKMTGMPTYAKEVFARFIRRSDSKKAETLEALEASKNRKDIETFAALNDLIELRPLIEKENLKNSFTDTWHDALKVYRVQNTIESIRSSLERELQGVFPDEDVTVRVGDRTVVSKAEASFGSVGAVKGIQSFTKNCLQPTYDCFFDKQQRKWKR